MTHRFKTILITLILLCFGTFTKAQLSATFTATQTNICEGIAVGFIPNINNTNPITSVFWDFGDGTFVNDPLPYGIGKIYNTAGTYTIRLVVNDNLGNTDTTTVVDMITVNPNPEVSFTVAPPAGCQSLDVQFSPIISSASTSGWTWIWTFSSDSICLAGDALDTIIRTNPNPFTATFLNDGIYDVSLTVENQFNCQSDTVAFNVFTVEPKPVASFTTQVQPDCDETTNVTFTSNSVLTCTGSTTYIWDFGDGSSPQTTTQSAITHEYQTSGVFIAQLIITDGTSNGCSDTIAQTISVSTDPTVAIQAPNAACVNDVLQFNGSSTGAVTSWAWDFGDGTTSTLQNPSHAYTTAGCFTPSLTITVDSCSFTAVFDTCIVVNPNPAATFSSIDNYESCTYPHTMNFTSTTNGVANLSYLWDFGDGTTSILPNPVKTWNYAGLFPVSLTVASSAGCTADIQRDTVIIDSIDVDFTADVVVGCEPLDVQFTDNSTSYSGIISWLWDFGDGTTSTFQHPSHTYYTTGTYDVQLIVTTAQGCTDTLILSNYINVATSPTLSFSVSDNTPCIGDNISFINASSNGTNWLWFNGIDTVSGFNIPDVAFSSVGSYNVWLSAENNGCVDTLFQYELINLFELEANIGVSGNCEVNPTAIDFTDFSTGSPVDWSWDFGVNGVSDDTSNVQNPSYNYPSIGQYVATLTITNSNGCTDIDSAFVDLNPSAANFGWTTDSVECVAVDFPVMMVDSSQSHFGDCNWIMPEGAVFLFGSSDSICEPIISFDTAGIYNLTLITTSLYGCLDTITKEICVTDVTAVSNVDTTGGSGGLITTSLSYTDNGNPIIGGPGGCVIQIDSLTGDTTYITAIGTTPINCNDTNLSIYSGCTPLTVEFSDSSFGFPDSIVSYLWNFGDGNTSSAQNPTHTYDVSSGEYAYIVTLTVVNQYGVIDTDTLPSFIRPTQPISNFSISSDTICTNMMISTIDSSSGFGLTYSWDFNNGNQSSIPNPSFSYAHEGTYEVCLTVIDINGCDSTYCDSVVVINPVANFSADTTYSTCDDLTVSFSDSSQNAISWLWLFGNDSASALQNPTTVYSGTGFYDLTLIVGGTGGCQDTLSSSSFIQVDGPALSSMSVSPTDSCEDHHVAFNIQGSNIGIVTIEFGDGNDSTFGTFTSLALDTTIYYVYDTAGIYNPVLRIQDSLNCERVFNFNTITTTDPLASFSLDTTLGCVPLTITANASASEFANQYQWIAPGATIGGQGTSSPTFTFQNEGYYNEVTLVVTDVNNCTDTLSFTDTITVANAFVGFYPDSYTGCYPLTVEFTDTSSAFADTIVSWYWEFISGDTDTLQNPTYIYDGNVNVNQRAKLTVTSSYGCVSSATKWILPTFPTASFMADTFVCTGQDVSFINQSTGLGLSYLWSSGDGTTATVPNPTYFYETEDTFQVTLTVTDVNGCVDIDTLEQLIVANPVANFSPDKTFITCAPDSIQFLDSSQNAVAWSWTIEGASPSNYNIQNPAVAYTIPGIYSAELIVTSISGCQDTMLIDSLITVDGPYGTISFSPEEGCVDLTVDYVLPLSNTANLIFDNGESIEVFVNPGDTLLYSYAYTQRGTYSPTVFIQDALGCQRILTDGSITVTDPEPIFTISPDTSCIPMTMTTTNSSLDVDDFEWFAPTLSIDNPNSFTPNFSTNIAGFHDVSLIVTDVYGCEDTLTQTVLASNVIANASSNVTAGCLPLTVQFSDLSTYIPEGSTNSWLWNFGDGGGVSTDQNPTYVYTTIGDFTPTLTVTNLYGCTSTYTLSTINVTYPSVSFVPSLTYACTGQDILFDNQSFGQNITYLWDFDNGQTSTQEDPIFAFSSEGTYNVCLTVTDDNGCDSTYCQVISIANPVANFTVDNQYLPCPPATFNFTDASVNAVSWLWSFGDGNTSTSQNPTQSYAATGFYDVQLIVTSASGCQDTLLQPTFIEVGGPVGSFTFTPNQGCADVTATFVGTLTTNSVTAYHWNFGNGDSVTHMTTAAIDSFDYVYTTSGTFFPTLTFEDSTGCQFIATLDSIEVDTLQFDFVVDTTLACENGTFTFTPTIASSSPIDSVVWNFIGADVTSSNVLAPTITYSTVGDFDVELTVYSRHCTKTVTKPALIKIAPDPVTNFVLSPAEGCNPTTVLFTDSTTIFSGNIISWAWDFGEGSVDSAQHTANSYDTVGVFDVSLTTVSNFGCINTLTLTDTVTINPIPNPTFDLDTFVCTGQDVTFTNTSTGNDLTYLWNFGDGNTSTAFEPIHQFATEDTFTVCLTVTSSDGCDSTLCKTVIVADPVANFTSDVQYVACPSDSISFTDASVNAVSWLWSFGDGNTSTSQNPIHSYAATGFYDVQLIVTSASGCQDTLLQPTFIEVGGPVGDFRFTPNQGCADVTATFVGTLTTNSVTAYHWNFGNGDSVTHMTTAAIDSFDYVYTTSGTFFPTLTLEDSTGCQFITTLDSIEVDTLQFDFVASNTLFCETDVITFTPTIASSSPIDSVVWIFDGAIIGTSMDSIPVIPYDTVGDFDVTLTVFSNHCSKTLTKPAYIKAAPIPESYFTSVTNPFCSEQTINFSDASTIFSGSIVNWNWDFGDMTTSTLPNPTHVYADSGFYTVNLQVLSDYGCSDDTTMTIYINKTPEPTMTTVPTLCIGEVFTLTATGGTTYEWYEGANLICDTCTSIDIAPITTTTYTLVSISDAGCRNTSLQVVNVLPYSVPPLVVSNDTTICKGDIIQLFASGGYDVTQYEWDQSAAGLSCYTHCTNPFASPETTTTFYVTLTWDGGCSKTDSITVTVIDDAQPILGVDRIICEGESVELGIAVGTNAVWSPSAGLSCVFCDNPVASPTETTTYAVEVTTASGCTIHDTITINVQTPEMIDAGEDATICDGTTIQLNGSAVGNFAWISASSLSDTTILNPIASPLVTTDYILTVQNDLCIQQDTVRIVVADKVDITVEDIEICEGETAEVDIVGYAETITLLPDSGIINTNPLLIRPTETAMYMVIGTVSSCEADTAIFTITVNPTPDIGLLPQMTVFNGTTTPLPIDNPNSQYMHTWTPSTYLSCADCFDPSITIDPTFEPTTIYVDVLTDEGCAFSDSILVMLGERCGDDLAQLPTAFTPNDDGNNDIFRVRGVGISDVEIFRVYNRWGEKLFETTNINEGWDGTYKGEKVEQGTYMYYVQVICPLTKEVLTIKGDVFLHF